MSVHYLHIIIMQSHSFHKAFWDGECALNEEQKAAHLLRIMVEPDQDELAEAMQDLGTWVIIYY